MLYYYFGSKEGLFRAVLAQRLAEQAESPRAEHLVERVATIRPTPSGRNYTRLHMWEALQRDGQRPVEAEELRQASAPARVDAVRAEQATGGIDPELDPAQVALMEIAMTMFPVAFPQVTRLITGLGPDTPEFRAAQRAFLERVAAALEPAATPVA